MLLSRTIAFWIATASLFGADAPLGLDAYMPVPETNPLTPERVQLGRKLFFDERLSRDRTVSCATCHVPELGFTDEHPVAVGIDGQEGTRRTPRLINRGYGRTFFWDGRAATLEDQVVKPIENSVEMDLALDELAIRLAESNDYAAAFRTTFGRTPDAESIAWALASYVRTIVSGDSPYDRYVAGDASALSEQQQRGLSVFRGKGACAVCHVGPNLADEEFHNTGVGWKDGVTNDVGRQAVTGASRDLGAFKTPTLRDVALTGPYMHDGSLETLKDVVEFYNDGGNPNPALDADMEPLDLTNQEKLDLVAFLKALNGTIVEGSSE